MATWILLFNLFFPTAPTAAAAADDAAADAGLRFRGIEAMFAKFEREAAEDGE